MSIEIHQNDITQFIATIRNDTGVVNVSAASIMQLVFQRPQVYTNLTVNASLYTDGTDGKITYTTASGDLSYVGLWKVQGIIQIGPSGWKSDIHTFKVARNL